MLITFGLEGHPVLPSNIVACDPADTCWVPIKAQAISSMAIDPVSIDYDIGGTLINSDSTCIPVVPWFADMVQLDLIATARSAKTSKTRPNNRIF